MATQALGCFYRWGKQMSIVQFLGILGAFIIILFFLEEGELSFIFKALWALKMRS